MTSRAPASPNLIDFGDSPKALGDDPFAIVASTMTPANPLPPPPPPPTMHTGMADPFAVVAHRSGGAATSAGGINGAHAPPSSSTTATPDTTAPSAGPSPSTSATTLHFFVSCVGVDGSLIQAPSRSAQTLVRGALSSILGGGGGNSGGGNAGSGSGSAGSSGGGRAKSPRNRPATDVCVEVRVTREFALPVQENLVHGANASGLDVTPGDGGPAVLDSESYWSERRRSRNPHFAVGFSVACHTSALRDRHVQVMIHIPEDGTASTKNAPLFGYAQTSFQELLAIATSGRYQQRLTLPVHSTALDGATVEIRFADVQALTPRLFVPHHSVFRSYLFYPPMREDQERVQAVAPKLAIEEATEVEFSVKIPLQLLRVCQLELRQMHVEWRARYNYNRKHRRFFEDDAEALNFGHDIFRVQVICGRNLSEPNAGDANGPGGGGGSARPSTFSITGGRNAIMSRFKVGGSNASSAGGGAKPSAVSTFVVVKLCDGNGATQEHIVGRTNTEYDSSEPVWSMNKSAASCPHGKPQTKYFVSPTLPSRVDISPVNQLKQFLFYRPSVAVRGKELGGWLRFEEFNESYGIMSGVENELIGEVLIPLQSLREAMQVEETIVWEGNDPATRKAHAVHSLTLVDWFDVRTPVSDEVCGRIQLRLQILLSNPAVSSPAELVGDGSDPVLSPRRQRLAADSAPPSSNPLESEMSLQFLYPHVLTLAKQISEVNDMIRICEHLVEQNRTFKSSQHKKRADIQGIPTNLHVAYFRIFRNFGCQSRPSLGGDQSLSTVRKASTEDLLGLGPPTQQPTSGVPATSPPAPFSMGAMAQTLEDRAKFAEVHATVTCGAPTAHAMGLSEYGLREMELEIHRLQNILDRCNPRASPVPVGGETSPFVSEDVADYAFSSLQNDIPDFDDDDSNAGSPQTSDPVPSTMETTTAAKPANKKYSNLAARAVAGAKATAKRKIPARSKSKGTESDDFGTGVAPGEIKYPPLKVDPDDGMDPVTSLAYAVRILSRLEMLRTEYYLRKSVSVAQSVSSLVTCFLAKLDLCLQDESNGVLEQMAQIGFLIGWESLISSHGKELRMLSDAWVAIKCLETFAFQLYEDNSTKDVVLQKREEVGYTIRVPVGSPLFARLPESLRRGGLITVTSVLFTQGINEMQSLANMVGHSGVSIQSKINSSSFRSIVDYYNKFLGTGLPLSQSHVGSLPDEILRNLRATVESENSASKNTHILFHAADAVRSLNGGRVTYCKSGKDRTAMSVTLEQARLLVQRKRHVLEELMASSGGGGGGGGGGGCDAGPLEEVKEAANIMREFGVRIEIAKKNVGRYKYSFNSLQRKLLPEIYRPPMSTIQDMVTSVTARDS